MLRRAAARRLLALRSPLFAAATAALCLPSARPNSSGGATCDDSRRMTTHSHSVHGATLKIHEFRRRRLETQ